MGRAFDIEPANAGFKIFGNLTKLRISRTKAKRPDRRHVLNTPQTDLLIQNVVRSLIDQNYRDRFLVFAPRRIDRLILRNYRRHADRIFLKPRPLSVVVQVETKRGFFKIVFIANTP